MAAEHDLSGYNLPELPQDFIELAGPELYGSNIPGVHSSDCCPEDLIDNDPNAAIRLLMASRLNEREREIIEMRFGLGESGTVYTQTQVSRHFGNTTERIDEIEQKALNKLREPDPRGDLWDYHP